MSKLKVSRSIKVRFWVKVDRSGGPRSCWPWKAYRNPLGYGRVSFLGKIVSAHRLAFQISKRTLRRGEQALHRCDHPWCCNPSHIFPGTNADNMADKKRKGRGAGAPCERNGRAKLSRSDVREILSSPSSAYSLAPKYDVSDTAIRNIRRGKSWRKL